MRRTNLHGHALRSEGKPYIPGDEEPWLRAHGSHLGRALCECGETSPVLPSDSRRRRWHVAHKDAVRGAFDMAPGHG